MADYIDRIAEELERESYHKPPEECEECRRLRKNPEAPDSCPFISKHQAWRMFDGEGCPCWEEY